MPFPHHLREWACTQSHEVCTKARYPIFRVAVPPERTYRGDNPTRLYVHSCRPIPLLGILFYLHYVLFFNFLFYFICFYFGFRLFDFFLDFFFYRFLFWFIIIWFFLYCTHKCLHYLNSRRWRGHICRGTFSIEFYSFSPNLEEL